MIDFSTRFPRSSHILLCLAAYGLFFAMGSAVIFYCGARW